MPGGIVRPLLRKGANRSITELSHSTNLTLGFYPQILQLRWSSGVKCTRRDSNPQPQRPKRCALSIKLRVLIYSIQIE